MRQFDANFREVEDGHAARATRKVARMAPKRIVVCTDGTWNDPTAASKLTNVDKLARAVQRSDARGVPQIVAYVPGVGTGADVIDRWIGGATGLGISRNIRNAYTFVVQNFTPGDELFLFGFSRGAFTARSLAGLIRNAGVLRPEEGHRIGEAYDLYRSRDPQAYPTSVNASDFRRRYSYGETRITFIGVWDTVGALGVPLSTLGYAVKLWGAITGKPYLHEFHDVALSSYVDHAYHAVSIDEHREAFRPTLWDPGTRRPDQSFEQVWFAAIIATWAAVTVRPAFRTARSSGSPTARDATGWRSTRTYSIPGCEKIPGRRRARARDCSTEPSRC